MFSEPLNNGEFEKKLETTIEQILDRKFSAIISEKIDKALRENDAFQAKKLSLVERIVRVEEELKALREIESTHFNALMREMNARFEAMDKRFEALQREMNARFEAMEKRFEAIEKRFSVIQWTIGIGFSFLTLIMGILKFWH